MFITNFMCSDNDVDGDTLLTLVGLTPGPDCLKELIPKIGTRIRVYKIIKACYDGAFVSYACQLLKLVIHIYIYIYINM